MTYFYAEENPYGCDTKTELYSGGKVHLVSAGYLYRFTTKSERDAWVDSAEEDHRQALTASAARKLHATGSLTSAVWDTTWTNPPTDIYICPCDKLVD